MVLPRQDLPQTARPPPRIWTTRLFYNRADPTEWWRKVSAQDPPRAGRKPKALLCPIHPASDRTNHTKQRVTPPSPRSRRQHYPGATSAGVLRRLLLGRGIEPAACGNITETCCCADGTDGSQASLRARIPGPSAGDPLARGFRGPHADRSRTERGLHTDRQVHRLHQCTAAPTSPLWHSTTAPYRGRGPPADRSKGEVWSAVSPPLVLFFLGLG